MITLLYSGALGAGRFHPLLLTACGVLARCQLPERAVGPMMIVVVAPRVQKLLGVGHVDEVSGETTVCSW